MGNETVAAAIPADNQVAIDIASLRSRQAKRTRWFLALFAFVVTAILGSVWWSHLLSSEEEAYLGRWVAIDAWNVQPHSSELFRELEFLPGHEVRLKVWLNAKPSPFFITARGLIYPQMPNAQIIVAATPHPASLPESVSKTPPNKQDIGTWKVEDGKIHIDWDTRKSLYRVAKEKYDHYVHRTGVATTAYEIDGTATLGNDGSMTTQWIRRSTRMPSPPQVWSRQPEKR